MSAELAPEEIVFGATDEAVVEIAGEILRSRDPATAQLDSETTIEACRAVADMLNAAIKVGYTIAAVPVALRKMRIEEGETLVLYNCDMPRALCQAVQNAIRRSGGPAKTLVLCLPPGQSIGLLTDAELELAGLCRRSVILVP